jgi:TorA maturation chaperone TorD
MLEFDRAVNMARQALYRFASLSLTDPLKGSWEQLHNARHDRVLHHAAGVLRGLPDNRPASLGPGELPVRYLEPGQVLTRLPATRDGLYDEYENAFGLVSSGCPPYETEYIDSKYAFRRSHALADINGFYQAFGLNVADQCKERPDHAALELEFMATLLALERQAADGDAKFRHERMRVCRDAQRRFLTEHLAWWMPAFARLLAHESRGGFYEAAAVFLAALVTVERALHGVEIRSGPVSPSGEESASLCDGCELAR